MQLPSISSALQEAIQNSIQYYLNKAISAFNYEYTSPDYNFNVRGKVAGKAYLTLWQIRLNPILFLENQDEFLQHVIPHELAHLIAYHQFGRVKPHGKEWQYIMIEVFGISAQTRHSFDISSVQGKTFSYQCQCREHELTIRRHNKIQRHQSYYHCTVCESQLIKK
ncbi:SprT family zinc-dependent metalloprotease [Vibrio casei]|uniref:SprT family zinc-dependent metalloprotease n=1 Tax=Vibrio casei TaxID=673372 RepID=UPI00097F0062|nr:SprT family zinc-dependent metalloprotease [Vibrio casei]SJN35228.1 Protein sprT [Vibrio casei]